MNLGPRQFQASDIRPLESEEQGLYFKWLNYVRIDGHDLRPHVYAVPNGGSRHRIEAARLQGQGVTAGVPDISIDVPSGTFNGMRIEMKRRGAKPTAEQLAQLECRRQMGYRAVVAEGFDEARISTVQYLRISWLVLDRWVG